MYGATEKRIAYIKDAKYGMGDYGKMALWFTASLDPSGLGSCALQVFHDETEIAIITDTYGVVFAEELNDKTCIVEVGGGMIKWCCATEEYYK